jgi:hypothetical protein
VFGYCEGTFAAHANVVITVADLACGDRGPDDDS